MGHWETVQIARVCFCIPMEAWTMVMLHWACYLKRLKFSSQWIMLTRSWRASSTLIFSSPVLLFKLSMLMIRDSSHTTSSLQTSPIQRFLDLLASRTRLVGMLSFTLQTWATHSLTEKSILTWQRLSPGGSCSLEGCTQRRSCKRLKLILSLKTL